jgi:hypothetical protein
VPDRLTSSNSISILCINRSSANFLDKAQSIMLSSQMILARTPMILLSCSGLNSAWLVKSMKSCGLFAIAIFICFWIIEQTSAILSTAIRSLMNLALITKSHFLSSIKNYHWLFAVISHNRSWPICLCSRAIRGFCTLFMHATQNSCFRSHLYTAVYDHFC